MNKLQKLAIDHIKKLAEQLADDTIGMSNDIHIKKEEFKPEKHSYPIAGKSREIARWAEAIIDSEK